MIGELHVQTQRVPFRMGPFVLAGTVITHLFGRSPSVSIKALSRMGYPLNKVVALVWGASEADIQALATQQKLFLNQAARVLKPGGQLVYSTCSVERDENEIVVEDFLQEFPAFTVTKTTRTWPHREGVDGFFIASFRLAAQQ